MTAGEAGVGTIVERIIGVLRQAQASLAEMRQSGIPNTDAPPARRFAFVHDPNLRPRLEQAFVDAQAALDRGAYDLAVVTSASILEAILTDALEHHIAAHGGASGVERVVSDWTFDARIGAAEQARLISLGCARLPAVARQYRELLDADGELRVEVRGDRAGREGHGPGAAADHAGFGAGAIDDDVQLRRHENSKSSTWFRECSWQNAYASER